MSVLLDILYFVIGFLAGTQFFMSLLYGFPKALMLTLKTVQPWSLPLSYLGAVLFYLVIFGILYYPFPDFAETAGAGALGGGMWALLWGRRAAKSDFQDRVAKRTVAESRAKADQGDAVAQYNLGVSYADGLGVPQDDAEAVRWLRVAADQGHAGAQFNLGVRYADGLGVPQGDAEAVRWFRVAADQGLALAQNNLGVMYANDKGIPQDDAEAVRWLRVAADQGHAEAQFNLGVRYADGLGVPQDDVEAVRWFRVAADQGFADAWGDVHQRPRRPTG